MGTVDLWVGAPSHDSTRIRGKVTGTSPVLEVYRDEALTGTPAATAPGTVDGQSIATFTVAGLAPGRTWWAAVRTGGVLDTSVVARFRTLAGAPGTPVSYSFLGWTCAGHYTPYPGAAPYVSNAPIFDLLTDLDVDFAVIGGDLHYLNNETASITPYRDAYDAVLSTSGTPRLSRHLRQVSTVYTWDDHDFGPNNSDSTDPGTPFAGQAYRERVPHFPLPDAGAIYHSFRVGRVLHIVSDTRFYRDPDGKPDGSDKTMLGAAQKAWMQQLLSTSDAEFLVWHLASQWMGTSEDSFAAYSTERAELLDMLRSPGGDDSRDWTTRMIQVSGDVHALALDDGSGNKWGGFPILVGSSVDSRASAIQTDLYRIAGRYVPTSPGRQRYGTVSITDTGEAITCTLTAWVRKWRHLEHTVTVATAAARTVDVAAVQEVSATATIDTGGGPRTVDIAEFSVDREIPTTMPDQVRVVSGVSAAAAKLVLPTPNDAGPGYHSPWRRGRRRTTARPVAIDVTVNGAQRRVFTGTTSDAAQAARDNGLTVQALDDLATKLKAPVAVPAFTADMGAAHPGASLGWVIEHVLHTVGLSPLPAYAAAPVVAASLAGSYMPNVGSIRPPDTNGDNGSQPTFIDIPALPVPASQTGEAFATPPETFEGWTGFTIGVVVAPPWGASTGNSRIRLAFRNTAGEYFLINLWVSPSVDRINVQLHRESGHYIDLPVENSIDFGALWWHLSRSGDTLTASIIQHCRIVGTGSITEPGIGAADVSLYDVVAWHSNVPMLGVQVHEGLVPVEQLPVWEQDQASADIAPPVSRILGVPGLTNLTGTEILRAIADAEQGGFWLDEDGRAVFRSRAAFRGLDTEPIPVTSRTSLVDLRWRETIDQLASTVQVSTTHPVATRATASPSTLYVWQADQIFSVPGKKWLRLEVDLNTPAGAIEPYMSWDPTGSHFEAHRSRSGSGDKLTGFPTGRQWRGVRLISSTRARIDFYNPYPYPIYFVGSDGTPAMWIAATTTITETDPVAVARDTGIPDAGTLALPDNVWRQDITDVEQLAVYLAEEARDPRPLITGVEVVPNLDIRLGSIVDLQDPDITGADLRALVRKVSLSMKAGQLRQVLEVQPLRVTLGDVDQLFTGQTLGDVDAYWTGRTLGDIDAAPLEPSTIYLTET